MKERFEAYKNHIDIEVGDILFNLHMKETFKVCRFIIYFQLVLCIVSVICWLLFKNSYVSKVCSVTNIVLCIVTAYTCWVGTNEWRTAKNKYKKISALLSLIVDDMEDNDRDINISALLGLNIPTQNEDEYKYLKFWYSNIGRFELCGKYKDIEDKQYQVGDIVLNQALGDIWLVEKLNDKEIAEYKVDNKYVLSLYGNRDVDCISIDEPYGFKIICRTDDYDYIKYIQLFKDMFTIYSRDERK